MLSFIFMFLSFPFRYLWFSVNLCVTRFFRQCTRKVTQQTIKQSAHNKQDWRIFRLDSEAVVWCGQLLVQSSGLSNNEISKRSADSVANSYICFGWQPEVRPLHSSDRPGAFVDFDLFRFVFLNSPFHCFSSSTEERTSRPYYWKLECLKNTIIQTPSPSVGLCAFIEGRPSLINIWSRECSIKRPRAISHIISASKSSVSATCFISIIGVHVKRNRLHFIRMRQTNMEGAWLDGQRQRTFVKDRRFHTTSFWWWRQSMTPKRWASAQLWYVW